MAAPLKHPVCVPIRVDAMWSDGSTNIAPPATDFSELATATSADVPWLGTTSHVAPTSDVTLPAGVHLHWTLPSALRRGTTVYVLDYQVFNELVRQGVPCALVEALKAVGLIGQEYTLDQLNALLASLAPATNKPLKSASAFDLLATSKSYKDLVSSNSAISVATYMPIFEWDAVFLQIYGPLVVHTAARMKLPPVPNRWLVVRTDTSSGDSSAWVVESDRLTVPKADGSAPDGAGPTAIPGEFDASFVANQTPMTKADALQYLGLTTPAASWKEDSSASRLAPLTAAGHGQPDFAVFYPNCQGVFGFHDSTADQSIAYDYMIIGWFADPTNDPASASYAVAPWSTEPDLETRLSALGWTLDTKDWGLIDGSLYAVTISVTGNQCLIQPTDALDNVDVAIGNTAGEALSAYIAQGHSDSTLGVSPENIVNAAQAGVLQQALDPDGPAVIENTLHGQGFQALPGGWIWQVASQAPTDSGLSAKTPDNVTVTITDAMAQALNTLNSAQIGFDRTQARLQDERHMVFTDWVRAMHLGTDDAQAGPNSIFPNGGISANSHMQLVFQAGTTVLAAANTIDTASIGGSSDADMLAYKALIALYQAHTAAAQQLASMPGGSDCLLRRQPAPRYWRPNDPVIMMTETSGQDLVSRPANPLPYQSIQDQSFLTLQLLTAGTGTPTYLPNSWDTNAAVPAATVLEGAVSQVLSLSCAVSWRPLSLCWETQFQQFPGAGAILPQAPDKPPFQVVDYATNFITSNFEPDKSGIDFVPASGKTASSNNIGFYRGRVPLSSHASETMRARILQLTGQTKNPPQSSSDLTLPGALGSGLSKTLISAAFDNNATTLSQTLNGFSDHLLMLDRLAQISIFDPQYTESWNMGAAPAWDALSQSFLPQIGLQSRSSPAQNNIYNPIRAGKCEVTNLTLVDAFGQTRTWTYSPSPLNVVISESLPNETSSVAGAAPAFFLPPRLAQASRLLFRWLAADGSNDAESNQAPDTTPVCGWVALNRIDENVMIFTADGTLVGWIPDGGGAMTYLPGRSAADLMDPFLLQVVNQAETSGSTFFDDIDTALLTIEPRSHRQHASRSILESRPLAIARTSLQLQLAGIPAPHQGYEALATMSLLDDGNPATGPAPSPFIVREDCAFTAVNFPVSLGDVSMDDDGLVLYWPVDSGTIASSYTLVGADAEAGPNLQPTLPLQCAPWAAATQVLLLLDPRAPVHVTSRILPVKDITIPPAMYADAVRNMEYLMQVGPVLTPDNAVAMPLPTEICGSWSWVYKPGSSGEFRTATPVRVDDKFHPKAEPAVLRTGFLKAGADNA